MDVGAGSGIVSIAAKIAGAKHVIASDIDAISQPAIKLNSELNNQEIEVIGDFLEYKGHVDIILLSDLLYNEQNLFLLDLFLKKAKEVVIADSIISRHKKFEHKSFI